MSSKKVTVSHKDKKIEEKKITPLSDSDVLSEIKKALEGQYIWPSGRVMDSFKNKIFTQQDLEYLVKYGDRSKKHDYIKGDRLVYGVIVTDKDQRTFYGQFDLKHKTLVTMEKIDVT